VRWLLDEEADLHRGIAVAAGQRLLDSVPLQGVLQQGLGGLVGPPVLAGAGHCRAEAAPQHQPPPSPPPLGSPHGQPPRLSRGTPLRSPPLCAPAARPRPPGTLSTRLSLVGLSSLGLSLLGLSLVGLSQPPSFQPN
jgi:hypothetical protein